MADDEWKDKLTPEQYQVLRQKGTEVPGSGKYVDFDEAGVYRCAACGQELFASSAKFESTMPGLVGWPAFSELATNDAVELIPDDSAGMRRTEIVCANCKSHLGHLFEDDPDSPTGQHYCVNSVALDFTKKG
jgi:peptide-methionine (R)-S-oxide reductase